MSVRKQDPCFYNDLPPPPHPYAMGWSLRTLSMLMAELPCTRIAGHVSKLAVQEGAVAAGLWDAQHCQGVAVPDLSITEDFSFEN